MVDPDRCANHSLVNYSMRVYRIFIYSHLCVYIYIYDYICKKQASLPIATPSNWFFESLSFQLLKAWHLNKNHRIPQVLPAIRAQDGDSHDICMYNLGASMLQLFLFEKRQQLQPWVPPALVQAHWSTTFEGVAWHSIRSSTLYSRLHMVVS